MPSASETMTSLSFCNSDAIDTDKCAFLSLTIKGSSEELSPVIKDEVLNAVKGSFISLALL